MTLTPRGFTLWRKAIRSGVCSQYPDCACQSCAIVMTYENYLDALESAQPATPAGEPQQDQPTEAQQDEFIKSFAYGNVKLHNPTITREMIDEQFELLKAKKAVAGFTGLACKAEPVNSSDSSSEIKVGDWVKADSWGEDPPLQVRRRDGSTAFFDDGAYWLLQRLRKVDPPEVQK